MQERVPTLYVCIVTLCCFTTQVDGPGTSEPRSGPVVVRVEDYRGESKTLFKFVDPEIEGIKPKYGPKSGGTILHITGKFMNAGSNIQAFIDDLPCKMINL